MKASILISSRDRTALLRRTLRSIATYPPTRGIDSFEVVLADDGSTEDVLGLLESEFSAAFPWKFVRIDPEVFERATGTKRFFNNPALTNNVAFRECSGDRVFLTGNEIIVREHAFDRLLEAAEAMEREKQDAWIAFATTLDLDEAGLSLLDPWGSNLDERMVRRCASRPLQSEHYRSDVTNYLSLCPRGLWEKIGGYDERYLGGISADDSDFVRRARAAGAKTRVVPDALTLHQWHGGKNAWRDPLPEIVSPERWDEGVRRNHAVYHAWDGVSFRNPQPWPAGGEGMEGLTTLVRENRGERFLPERKEGRI